MSEISFRVVTVCNRIPRESYYCLYEFFQSLQGHPLLLLGTKHGEYTGLGSKPKLLYKAIKTQELIEKYIIFCDCWDLVFAVRPKELIYKYLDTNSPIVVSTERNCFPADLKDEYDKLDATSSYKYLNSGMIVAETEAMLAVLEAMDLPNIPEDYYSPETGGMVHINDQFLYQKIFLQQPVKMVLDYNQILCNTLHQNTVEDLDFRQKRIRNAETGSFPCSFHLNGSAKTDGLREPLLKHLNLFNNEEGVNQ